MASSPQALRLTRSASRYNVTGTMDRVRGSLVGGDLLEDTHRSFEGTQAEESESLLRILDDEEENKANYDSIDTAEPTASKPKSLLSEILSQVPAVTLIGIFHLMIGIPFGVSYFPVGWRSSTTDLQNSDDETDEEILGAFPIPGKEALGIRMFLFSTIIAQLVFTLNSKFDNPIGLQMVENIPFCHSLSMIVIEHQGYGSEALSTLFVMFGAASLLVGAVFYLLGKLKLGRIVYFFPSHVLVGAIGGIGVLIAKTGTEVTMDDKFGLQAVLQHIDLLSVIILFEIILRVLQRITVDAEGKPRFPLLSAIYFILITPIFYLALWVLGTSVSSAQEAGYFFPPLDNSQSSNGEGGASAVFNSNLLDIWRVVDISTVSWPAIFHAMPTIFSLILFSLIHVPINIPAFAVSTDVEADMNRELVAHGYSNFFAGIFCGLQNYMAYTQSILYDRSGGTGKASGLAVAAVTSLLFFIGPAIASYIPRCMAGTLLLHVGIDLFLEGVYDSYGRFDELEYFGVWLITLVMTFYGMDAAMVAGVLAAISTYAVQSIKYMSPIRGTMCAATLRSSKFHRDKRADKVLDDAVIGRHRIFVIQLQGHLFFGNMAQLTESIQESLTVMLESNNDPWVVILDFTLVNGIDSSAAQAITKFRGKLNKTFHVQTVCFVTGNSEGFPTEFDLTAELTEEKSKFHGSYVFDSLNDALIWAEDALIYRQDPSILTDCELVRFPVGDASEYDTAIYFLSNLCPGNPSKSDLDKLFAHFTRETYKKDDIVWLQGSPGDSIKLVVSGRLISLLEDEAGTRESIGTGNTIGEVGLVNMSARLSTVCCLSNQAIVYSLSRASYEKLVEEKPKVARLIDLICVKYLTMRVQNVSNRIFETRCLPI